MLRVGVLFGLAQVATIQAAHAWTWCPVPEIDGSVSVTVIAFMMGAGVLLYNKVKA
jgi:hypothetical protein